MLKLVGKNMFNYITYYIPSSLYYLQYVPRSTTVVTVTPRVVSVEEVMHVTLRLGTVQMDANNIGTDPGVKVSIQGITICYRHVIILSFFLIIVCCAVMRPYVYLFGQKLY